MSSENQVVTDTTQQTMPLPTTPSLTPQQTRLVDTVISDQHIALNVIVGFIGVAQKRGIFQLDESAKLYECIKMFHGEPNSN